MIVPQWSHCLEYEFQVRKAAIQLTRSQGLQIQKALWSVYRNEQHRMEHWVTLLTIANAAAPSSPNAALTSKLNRMEQQIATLLRERSRTPAPGKGSRTQPKAAQQSRPRHLHLISRRRAKGKAAKVQGRRARAKARPRHILLRVIFEVSTKFVSWRPRQGSLPRERSLRTRRLLELPVSHALPSHSMPAASHLHRLREGQRPLRRLPLPRERPLNDRFHGHGQPSGRGFSCQRAVGVSPFTFHAYPCRGFSCHCRHPSYFAASFILCPCRSSHATSRHTAIRLSSRVA